jgi:ribosomal protein S25
MSGQKKKWTKVQNKDKRDWAQVLLPEVAAEIEKYVPKSRFMTPAKLAERYKISMTIARKVLRQFEMEGKVDSAMSHHTLHAYCRPVGAIVEAEVEEVVVETKPQKGKKQKK